MSRLEKRKVMRKMARNFMKKHDIKGHFDSVYKGVVLGVKKMNRE
jgi:hypothetical protein